MRNGRGISAESRGKRLRRPAPPPFPDSKTPRTGGQGRQCHSDVMAGLFMAGLSRPKDGVASPAYVPAIHVLVTKHVLVTTEASKA